MGGRREGAPQEGIQNTTFALGEMEPLSFLKFRLEVFLSELLGGVLTRLSHLELGVRSLIPHRVPAPTSLVSRTRNGTHTTDEEQEFKERQIQIHEAMEKGGADEHKVETSLRVRQSTVP